MRLSPSSTLGVLAILLLLSLQVVLGKPQQASLGTRAGLLTDDGPKDALGAGRNTDKEGNAPICCRCVSIDAPCNNDLDKWAQEKPKLGLTCKNEIESDVFGCDVDGVKVSDEKNLIDLRSPNRCSAANGQKTCCDPVSNRKPLIDLRDGAALDLRTDDVEDIIFGDTEKICQQDDVGATANFELGQVCGKRDSRVYMDAGLAEGFTNPGEWPWSVLIYAETSGSSQEELNIPAEPPTDQRCRGRNYGERRCCNPENPCEEGEGDCDGAADGGQHDGNNGCKGNLVCGSNNCKQFGTYYHKKDDCCERPEGFPGHKSQQKVKRYIGSGALLDNDVVATVGHKMKDFINKPEELVVHVGDWDPNSVGGPFGSGKEQAAHREYAVDCVKIHDRADLDSSLENNVAVLKLRPIKKQRNIKTAPFTKPKEPNTVRGVVDIRSNVRGVIDLRSGDDTSGPQPQHVGLGERSGLLTDDNQDVDPLGAIRAENIGASKPLYINTVCLPESQNQFTTETCWVAAWGSDLKRQREVDIPLVSRAQCQRVLEPEFREKGVLNWKLKPSEVCAGGVPGKDTCQGEGGAPLVCYSRTKDQYFAVGLVSYGFGCNGTLPAVYTNLMDSGVQRFIKQAFDSDYCGPF